MSYKVARVDVDICGGVIIGPGAPTVTVNDKICSVIQDRVQTHGDPPHVLPPIVTAAPTIFAEDKRVTLTTISQASCRHQVSTGSPDTFGL